jgi:hypothetical protein
MKTIREDDLIFDISAAMSAEKFDDDVLHGTKSTMKRVDIIIENSSEFIFLEVKDPDKPGAKNPDHFKQQFLTGNFIPEIAGQCRDTLLFTKLRQEYTKPIIYVVLVCMEKLDDALVLPKIDALKCALPLSHKSWIKDSIESCIILKLGAYKKKYGENSVWRHSDYE